MEKLTKNSLAKQLGISRPTLDRYLEEGFPTKMKENLIYNGNQEDCGRQRVLIENNIRLCEYEIQKYTKRIEDLKKELENLEVGNNE